MIVTAYHTDGRRCEGVMIRFICSIDPPLSPSYLPGRGLRRIPASPPRNIWIWWLLNHNLWCCVMGNYIYRCGFWICNTHLWRMQPVTIRGDCLDFRKLGREWCLLRRTWTLIGGGLRVACAVSINPPRPPPRANRDFFHNLDRNKALVNFTGLWTNAAPRLTFNLFSFQQNLEIFTLRRPTKIHSVSVTHLFS
jgi:hypothetical protein